MYRIRIQARARVAVTEQNRSTIWTALNNLHDALRSGTSALGDFWPDRCEIDLENGNYEAECWFTVYAASDVKAYLRTLLGGRPADADVRIWQVEPREELLRAIRVNGSVTWFEYSESETSESLS